MQYFNYQFTINLYLSSLFYFNEFTLKLTLLMLWVYTWNNVEDKRVRLSTQFIHNKEILLLQISHGDSRAIIHTFNYYSLILPKWRSLIIYNFTQFSWKSFSYFSCRFLVNPKLEIWTSIWFLIWLFCVSQNLNREFNNINQKSLL